MDEFNLQIVGTEEFIKNSKKEIKKMLDEGKDVDLIVDEVFNTFPKDTKEMISKNLKRYL